MLSTIFYVVPLVPGGMFLGALLLLLIVPVFAVAALALAVLLGAAVLLGLVAATAAAPVLLVRAARRQSLEVPNLPWSEEARLPVKRQEEDPWALDPLSPL